MGESEWGNFNSNWFKGKKNMTRPTLEEIKREGYKARIADLTAALELALAKLIKLEPPDSRAVSDEYVAMAAVHAGGDIVNDEARQIIAEGLAREAAQSLIEELDQLPFKVYRPQEGIEVLDATDPGPELK